MSCFTITDVLHEKELRKEARDVFQNPRNSCKAYCDVRTQQLLQKQEIQLTKDGVAEIDAHQAVAIATSCVYRYTMVHWTSSQVCPANPGACAATHHAPPPICAASTTGSILQLALGAALGSFLLLIHNCR